MSEEKFPKFLLGFPTYLDTIEGLRPLKRPMLLWATVSMLYVFMGLQLEVATSSDDSSNTSSVWGLRIVGLTDTELTIFFILATLYYTVKWLWTTYLQLRTYIDDEFISMLWKYGMPQSGKEKEDGREGYAFRKGYVEAQLAQPFVNEIGPIEDVRSKRGVINDLFDPRLRVRLISCVEHIGLPYLLPLAIAGTALIALVVRLCCL